MPRVAVVNTLDASVTFFDATTRKKVGSIKTGASPQGIAVAKNGKFGYVTSAIEGSVSVIDVVRMRETGRLTPAGVEEPAGICVLADGRSLFMTGASDGVAWIVDATSGKVRSTVDLGVPVTSQCTLAASGDRVWLASPSADRLIGVDARTGHVAAEMDLVGGPAALDLARDQRRLLVGLRKPARLALVDPADGKVAFEVPVGENPVDVAAHPYADQAFVLSRVHGHVAVVDLASGSVSAPIPVGLAPQAMAVARAGKTLYVANSESDSVSVVEVLERRVRDVWATGHHPGAVIYIG